MRGCAEPGGNNVIRLLRKTGLVDGEDYMGGDASNPPPGGDTPTVAGTPAGATPEDGDATNLATGTPSPAQRGGGGGSRAAAAASPARTGGTITLGAMVAACSTPTGAGAPRLLSPQPPPTTRAASARGAAPSPSVFVALPAKTAPQVLTEWPCHTRPRLGDDIAVPAKPKLLFELEKMLSGPVRDELAVANACMAKMSGAFKVYGQVITRVQDMYNRAVEEPRAHRRGSLISSATDSPTSRARAVRAGVAGDGDGGGAGSAAESDFLQGFLKSTADRDLGHEAAVLIDHVRKLERKLANYKAEVIKLSGDTRHLNDTLRVLASCEDRYNTVVEQRQQLQMRFSEQGILLQREQQLKEEAQEELAETKALLGAAVKANRAGSPAWRKMGGAESNASSRIGSRIGSFRSSDHLARHASSPRARQSLAPSGSSSRGGVLATASRRERLLAVQSMVGSSRPTSAEPQATVLSESDATGEPMTPRPQFADLPNIDTWGLPIDEMRTADIVEALYKELAEMASRYSLMLQLDHSVADRIDHEAARLARHPMWIGDAQTAIRARLFKPLGDSAWLPSYLHAVKPVVNMQLTHSDTMQLITEYHRTFRGKRFETFFSEKARMEFAGRSTAEVAYSFLHALQRYSDVCANCAMFSLVLSGYLGYWIVDSVVQDLASLEDAFRRIDGGIHFQRRAGHFVHTDLSGTLKARTCTVPEMVEAIDVVYAGMKSPQALLQLKNAAVATHMDHESVTSWGHLLALRSDREEEVHDSEFLATLKMQRVHEAMWWVRTLAAAICARCEQADGEAPTIYREAARHAVAAADRKASWPKVMEYTDRVFHTAAAYHKGKDKTLTSTPSSLWIPVPSLVAEQGETRFDTMARLATLDMGQGPLPFSGVQRDRRDNRDDLMTVAEFLHVARYAEYTPSTAPPATIPSEI